KITSFTTDANELVSKSFSLCNSTSSDVSLSWSRESNPDANMLDWFTWPIVDVDGVEINSVASGDCAYFDLNFIVPKSAVSNIYDANITLNYGDGNTSSAYFFINVTRPQSIYSLFFSTSNNTLPANYFLSSFVTQKTDANYFTPSGELDWRKGLELSSSDSLFDSNLVGLWHLNDKNSEGYVLNSASGIRDGQLVGGLSTDATGLWDTNAIELNGDGTKYVNLGTSVTNPSLDLNQEFTVSAWINYKGGHSVNAMSAIYSSEYYWSYNHGWSFHINDQVGTGVLEFAAGQNVIVGQGTSNVPQNEWTHVLMTRTLNNQIKLYVNGALDAVRDLDPSYVITSTPDSPIRIGLRASQQDNDDFNGLIEEVAVWDRVLSPAEVSELYGLQKKNWLDDHLVAYYKFNSKNGSTIFDSANDNDGTLSGGADINAIGLWDSNSAFFNGTDAWIYTGDLEDLHSTRDLTLSAWIYPSADGVVFNEVGTPGSWYDSQLEIVGTDVKYRVWNTSILTLTGVKLNSWNFVSLVYNDSARTLTGYLNGVSSTLNVDQRQHPILNGGQPIYSYGIGQTSATNLGSGTYFSGQIDEVKIYNRALSALEVLADYNSFLSAKLVDSNIVDAVLESNWNSFMINSDVNFSFGREIDVNEKFGDGLVGLWHLNETSGSDVLDSSGNNNTGIGTNDSGVTITTDGDYTIYTFDYIGEDKTFTVSNSGTINVKMWGAGGGGGQGCGSTGSGGGGGYSTADIVVTQGQTYSIVVGRGGSSLPASTNPGNTVYGGGGLAPAIGFAGQGGGLSGIFLSGETVTYDSSGQSRAIIIAGGGGGGGCQNYAGGAGGGETAQDGAGPETQYGHGATQLAGGISAYSDGASPAGSEMQGASSGSTGDSGGAGGGGGGYFGGSCGWNGDTPLGNSGGGGGSGYVPEGGTTLTGSNEVPANSSDSDRGTAGEGGAYANSGNSGRVVIKFLTSSLGLNISVTPVSDDGLWGLLEEFLMELVIMFRFLHQ
ncbi:MAG: LamG domain-containing protein, partial [Sphaerochaetaceae bacterium]|nr:LamG domain-containing protein [Sphaerochaetaceae bacterium]